MAGETGYGPGKLPSDSTELLSRTDSPKLLAVTRQSGFDELREQGLAPAEPWGRWHGQQREDRSLKGVLDRDFENENVFLVLYDRQRPTTGYQFAILNVIYGSIALREIGEKYFWINDEQPPESYPVLLDMVATAPRDNWNVEHRGVSSYQVTPIWYADFDSNGVLDLAIRVNGELVLRRNISRDELTDAVVELPLPEIREMALP
jgi:hypothetical protein